MKGGPLNDTNFVLLTAPRSGSTWLVSMLNKVEGASAYGELFLPRKRQPDQVQWDVDFAYPRFFDQHTPELPLRPLKVFAYLNRLYRQEGVVGFKLMYAHLKKYPELFAYLQLRRIRVIHLVRRNSFDVILSQALNQKLNLAHQISGQERHLGDVQVELDTKTLLRRLRRKQRVANRYRALLRLSLLPHMEIAYEDLVQEPKTFRSICKFLSLPEQDDLPESKFTKIRKKSQADIIRNYTEVRNLLAGTEYECWLSEEPFYK